MLSEGLDWWGFFDRRVYSPLRLVALVENCSELKKIQIPYSDKKSDNIFPSLRSGYLVYFQIRIKLLDFLLVLGVSNLFRSSNSSSIEHMGYLQSCDIVIPLFYAYAGIK